jgi:serine protease Do
VVHAQDFDEGEEGLKALEQIQYSFRRVAKKVLPAVVEINVIEVIRQQTLRSLSPWEFFFGPMPRERTPREREFRRPGLGSGVIVRKNGDKVYVLTNNHVVGAADEISVKLYDKREFEADLVGKAPRLDLALVSFRTRDEIPVAELGVSNNLKVGDWVIAVGNPFGFEATVTAGIVSALGRRAEQGTHLAMFTDYIQTDAAINPGNSGGALANIAGRIVGINTWIASQSGGSVGLGFAVPIDNAKTIMDQLIEKGRVIYGWLGVIIEDPNPELYPELTDSLGLDERTGALVVHLVEGSPAEKYGLLPGDYIYEVREESIRDSNHLTTIVGKQPPGTTISFKLIRYREQRELEVKLEERGDEEKVQRNADIWPGFVVAAITDQIRSQLELASNLRGVVIYNVVAGSAADDSGLSQGDVISQVNGREVGDVLSFYRELNRAASNGEIRFRLFRQGRKILIGLTR